MVKTQLRHEIKCVISIGQYYQLSETIPYILPRDPYGDEYNLYNVRSLYFDDVWDSALLDKINGVKDRAKYRIRLYNRSADKIMLECKQKRGEYFKKQSLEITRDICDQICTLDVDGLYSSPHSLLRDIYRQVTSKQLHPVVIVEYDREAYFHPVQGIRITFDKQLRTGLLSTSLFDFSLPLVSAMDSPCVIMEVKYESYLPDYITSLIAQVDTRRTAVSKYVICRRFE